MNHLMFRKITIQQNNEGLKDWHQEASGSYMVSSCHSICNLGFKQVPWTNLKELLFMTDLVKEKP